MPVEAEGKPPRQQGETPADDTTWTAPRLAEPWRRLAASATDAAFLVAAHLLALTVLILILGGNLDGHLGDWLPWLSLAFSWAYVWIGLSFGGATLGKRLWGIRVVSRTGAPLTPDRAALRCLGYVVACLPARVGLLAVLWDPLRRGWHDRIAGTLVVRASGASVPQLPPQEPVGTCEPLVADLSAPLCRWWLPLSVYVLLALTMTYPLALHINTERAGVKGDGSVFLWNLWAFSQALSSGQPLTSTDLIYYPQRPSLLHHTMNWLACVVAVPLLRVFNLTTTYNLLFLAALVACAYSMYWTVCALTGDRPASAAAALAFGFSPYFLVHGLGHLNLVSAQFLPISCLLLLAALASGRVSLAVGAGVSLALSGLCEWYYLVFGVLAAASVTAGVFATSSYHSRALLVRCVAFLGLSLALAVAIDAPLLLPTVREDSGFGYAKVSLSVVESFKAEPFDLLVPNPFHPLLRGRRAASAPERIVTPGLTIIALGLVGLWRYHRRLLPWVVLAGCGLVLSWGPSLSVAGRSEFNLPALLLLGGVPGSALDPPWTTQATRDFCIGCLARPDCVLRRYSVPLPFTLLRKSVPLLRAFKVPARLGLLTILSFGVFAAFGLSALRSAATRRCGTLGGLVLVAAVGALILLEYLMVPYPTFPTATHPFYQQLSTDSADYAIIDVPLNPCLSEYQAYQTVHHKKLFVGNLARVPPHATDFLARNRLLVYLSGTPMDPDRDGPLILRLTQIPPSVLHTPSERAALDEALVQLCRARARYVVVHKDLLDGVSLTRCRDLLTSRLELPVVLEDRDLIVYALSSREHATPQSQGCVSNVRCPEVSQKSLPRARRRAGSHHATRGGRSASEGNFGRNYGSPVAQGLPTRSGVGAAGGFLAGAANLPKRAAAVSLLLTERKPSDMKPRPDLLDDRSPKGLEVFQITTEPDVPSSHLYMEAQVFTTDSKRFVLHRSATAHGGSMSDPKHQYLLCDLEDNGSLTPLTEETGVTGASVSPDDQWVYYFVNETQLGGGRLTLKRVGLDGAGRDTVCVVDTPLPGTSFRPSAIYSLSTISSDGRHIAISGFLGDGQTENAPFGLMVFDIERTTVNLVIHGPTWCNMHPQYCRSKDPEESHDILIQENHDSVADARGSITRLVGGAGADIHVLRDDGTNFRNMPWGRDGNEFCQGHQCWRGRSSWAITSTNTCEPPEAQLIEGKAAPFAGHVGINTPGGVRNDLSRDFPGPHFCHFATDIEGTRLVSDAGPLDTRATIWMGHLGEPGKDPISDWVYLLNPRSTCQKTTHIHPFLSPDGTMAFFNSDESGILQAYMACGF